MARRRTSRAEDLASVAIGPVSYILLHAHAISPIAPVAPGPAALHDTVTSSMSHGLASVGQYAMSVLCLAAAAMSFVGRRKRRQLLLHTTEDGSSAAAIDAMSWHDFEVLIGEAF